MRETIWRYRLIGLDGIMSWLRDTLFVQRVPRYLLGNRYFIFYISLNPMADGNHLHSHRKNTIFAIGLVDKSTTTSQGLKRTLSYLPGDSMLPRRRK